MAVVAARAMSTLGRASAVAAATAASANNIVEREEGLPRPLPLHLPPVTGEPSTATVMNIVVKGTCFIATTGPPVARPVKNVSE